MTRRSCSEALVGSEYWLPVEPFDYAWAQFGCNQLGCEHCGQAVRASAVGSKASRLYQCGCNAREEYGIHVLGSDDGRDRAFEHRWGCAGHPALPLPTVLDGVALSDLSSWSAVVNETLSSPPFRAPGFDRPSFWVERLYHIVPLDTQRREIGPAVVRQVVSSEPTQVAAALSFFLHVHNAPGASELAAIADREAERLRSARRPDCPSETLYDRMLEVLVGRLHVLDASGEAVDGPALLVVQAAALRGEASSDAVVQLSRRAPRWFCQHAVALVRARPTAIGSVRFALREGPPSKLEEAVESLLAVDSLMHSSSG